jgi:hypothetical protein
MERKISFQSSADHYVADACIVWCFDDRFSDLLGEFSKTFKNSDLVKIAGGAKALAGGPTFERDFVLNQIKTSIKLHGTKRIALMLHRDCGAYGGSKSFVDTDAELNSQKDQLSAAKNFLSSEISDIPVDLYFADFDGLYAI